MVDESVRAYCGSLDELGIENAAVEHPASKDVASVLSHLGLTFADCAPTLIMRADDADLAVVIRGDTRADFKRIKKLLGVRNLRMATPDEFTQATGGLPVGTARVYTPGLRTVLDTLVFEKEHLTGGSGRFDCSVRVRTAQLVNIPGSLVAEVRR